MRLKEREVSSMRSARQPSATAHNPQLRVALPRRSGEAQNGATGEHERGMSRG